MYLEIAYFSRAINSRDFNEHSERRECSSLRYDFRIYVYMYIDAERRPRLQSANMVKEDEIKLI